MRKNNYPSLVRGSSEKKTRLGSVLMILILICSWLIIDLFNKSILKHQYFLALAHDQQIMTTDISPKRGKLKK